MKIKTVKRYYCDFCKKAMGRLRAMEKHEAHCTLNPNRDCGLCDIVEGKNNLQTLLSMIPDDVIVERNSGIFDFDFDYTEVENREEILDAFEKMKSEAGFCPACILAVLRQHKSRVAFDWDYKKEHDSFWNEYNQDATGLYDSYSGGRL